MEKLTELNKACLTNMPMMMDVMESTIDRLDLLLSPYQDLFIKQLETAFYEVKAPKKEYPCMWESVGVVLKISANKSYRRKLYPINIEFGYIWDKSQNVIYFQETSNFNDDIYTNIPNSFNKGKGNGDDGLYVEFSIDDTLSEEKIKRCADCFVEYILTPIIESHKQ